jgi:hypothetical protein
LGYLPLILAKAAVAIAAEVAVGVEVAETVAEKTIEDNFL